MNKSFLLVIIFTISLTGCIPTKKILESEYKIISLTSELAESIEKDFSVHVPPHWFSTRDIENNADEIWLVQEDYSAVIGIKKILSSILTQQQEPVQTLHSLAKTSLFLNKRKYQKDFKLLSRPELYRNGDLIYSSYEFAFGKNQIARIVIFSRGSDYFECIAYSSQKGYGNISLVKLYSVQESVINSLRVN